MSANPPCMKCQLADNTYGVVTCNGCRQSFCLNHLADHRNELRTRFEEVSNTFNRVKESFCDWKRNSYNSQWTINKREREINQIKLKMHNAEQNSSYSETDLDQWKKQLDKLRKQLTRSHSLILTLKLCGLVIFLPLIIACVANFALKPNSQFSHIHGPIQLSKSNRIAEHNDSYHRPGSFCINQIYEKGTHHVQLKFEKLLSTSAFIGIINTNGEQSISTSYGWFIGSQHIIDHKSEEWTVSGLFKEFWARINNQSDHGVKQDDTIELTVDCLHSKINLTNKRTNTIYGLDVDQKQSPLPWQIMISLDHYEDRVLLQ